MQGVVEKSNMFPSYKKTEISFFSVISLALLCFVLSLAFPTVTRAVIIGEYSILPAGTISGVDSGLAADPEGNIWFVDPGVDDKIGRITPAGDVTVYIIPGFGSLSGGITAGPDGNIWYTKEFAGGIIGRLSPTGEFTEFVINMDYPRRITTGPDGNLWFTGHHVTGERIIGRITPRGEVRKYPLSIDEGFPVGITSGLDGNLWFAVTGSNKIGRITTNGIITEFTIGGSSFDITVGPDGNIWFTEGTKIGRITPDDVITEFAIPTAGSYTYGITAGPDGNIWFAVNNRDKIGRVTPFGVFLDELSTPSVPSGPQHITASPDGLIWFTESHYNKIGVISQDSVSTGLPLSSGNSWSYQKNGVGGFTRTVSSGVFNINGVNTKRIHFSEGSEIYFTNDSNGVREHREYDPIPPATLITFSPPFKFTDAQGMLGVPAISSGTASGNQGGTPFSLPYSGSSTIEALEVISVPAGTFRTARIQSSVTISRTVTQTNWVAANIGVVKATLLGNTYLLESTNVINTTPDIFWFVPQMGVPLNMLVISNTITVSGITAPAGINITGAEYKINSGAYTTELGTVTDGDTVTLRQISANSSYTMTMATLTIGGVSAKFYVTTSFAPRAMPWLMLLLDD